MHQALRLEEILQNIFTLCYPPNSSSKGRADLAALARTCSTFKEPALDVLWTEMTNLSPLVRCLPEASHRIYPGCSWFAFSRSLEPEEWDILRHYARRVRCVLDITRGLSWESVKTIFNPPTSDPMFPNLRILRWEFIRGTFPLMRHLLVPSLTSVEINFVYGDIPPFESLPYSLGELCPNLKKVRIRMRRVQHGADATISEIVPRWRNLQLLFCPYISLDSDALLHLSFTRSLTCLSFMLSEAVADCITSTGTSLLFPNLRDLEISSESLKLIVGTLSHIHMPAIESLTAYIDTCPSGHTLQLYLINAQKICTLDSLVKLKVVQVRSTGDESSPRRPRHWEPFQLRFEDLQPSMVFSNLRHIDINTASTVHMTDEDMLHLASAWPRLEKLLINGEWGWKTESGVTPKGLFELLQHLPRLRHFCLAIDTRGFTDLPATFKETLATGFKPRVPFSVNVADSMIQPESVDALAAFFREIMQQKVSVSSCYWSTAAMTGRMGTEVLERLWEDVFMKANERVKIQYRVS